MANILLIEDDSDIRIFIQTSLQQLGFSVDVTDSVQDALVRFEEGDYDLVITDIILPESSGIEAIRKFKSMDEAVKILAISGGGYLAPINRKSESSIVTSYLSAAKKAGASVTISKPFNTKKLIEEVVCLFAA